MKKKILFSFLTILALLTACQKEILEFNKSEVSEKLYQTQLAELQAIIPDNVEIMPMSKVLSEEINAFAAFPDTTITLSDCDRQPCYQVVPSYLGQMQRTADLFCQSIIINICCCANDDEWCFRFKIHPQFDCVPLNIEK